MLHNFGPHRVQHGDVTKGIDKLMQNGRADIMYSDPPWGEGNIKYWATQNKKMAGDHNDPAPLDEFLTAVFGIAAKYVDSYLLVEYGVRWADEIQKRGVGAGFNPRGIIKLRYRSGGKLLPLDLHVFTRDAGAPLPAGYAQAVTDTYGYDTLKHALHPLIATVRGTLGRQPVVLDPCCGMGYTAQAALDCGAAFRGNELNRVRLGKTIARLQKAVKSA